MVTTSLETYFWLLDRLEIEDDSRNKVNMTNNSVALSKPFIKRIENGHYVGRLLADMQPTFAKRTEKNFAVPSTISDLDPEGAPYNSETWRVIFKSLADYGIELGKKR